MLVPVWVAGLVRLLRAPAARPFRFLAVGYLLLAAFYLLTGGKAYYLAGFYPALLAAGAVATDGWLAAGGRAGAVPAAGRRDRAVRGGRRRGRAGGAAGPRARPGARGQPGAGEQVAWPRYVETVAGVWSELSPVRAGHRGDRDRQLRRGRRDRAVRPGATGCRCRTAGTTASPTGGSRPARPAPVVVVGYGPDRARTSSSASCQQRATLDNGLGLDTEEQGAPVWLCGFPVKPWSQLWPELTHLG